MLIEVLEEPLLRSVRLALDEDIGSGDVTAALIPARQQADAAVVCREPAILCGMAWFDAVFAELDTGIAIRWLLQDGDSIKPGQTVCKLQGPARTILSGERTALNFLQTLSGTATISRQYADAVSGLPTKILDTRKTVPGLRDAQKYAVRIGGWHNHRQGLYDAILIKENHIAAAGSIADAIAEIADKHAGLMIEVEVENSAQIIEAMETGATRLLLDNFSLDELRAAVELVDGRIELEASGSFTLDNLRAAAETGVHFISTGALTKHVQAIDYSMRFDTP